MNYSLLDSGDDLQPHRGGCLLLSQFLCSKKQRLEESGRLVWNPNWRLEKETKHFLENLFRNSENSQLSFKMCFNRSIQGCSTSYSNYHLLPIATINVPILIWYNMHVEICQAYLRKKTKWDFGTLRWLSSELTNLLPTSGDRFCQLLYWWISQRLSAAGLMVKRLGMVSEDF